MLHRHPVPSVAKWTLVSSPLLDLIRTRERELNATMYNIDLQFSCCRCSPWGCNVSRSATSMEFHLRKKYVVNRVPTSNPHVDSQACNRQTLRHRPTRLSLPHELEAAKAAYPGHQRSGISRNCRSQLLRICREESTARQRARCHRRSPARHPLVIITGARLSSVSLCLLVYYLSLLWTLHHLPLRRCALKLLLSLKLCRSRSELLQ